MKRSMPGRTAVLAAALAATWLLAQTGAPAAPAPPSLGSLPYELSHWRGMDAPPLDPELAEVLAADEYVRRYYQGPDGVIEMDVAYYAQPQIGAAMHSPLNCLPGNGWAVASIATRPIATAIGTWHVRELIAERGPARYALTYWFQNRHRVVADEFTARFHLLADALRRRPTAAGLVRVMMPAAGDGRAERVTIADFARLVIPAIAARLDGG